MPIYEYQCQDCHRRVSLLILTPKTASPPRCPRCGSESLERLMSRFSTAKSEDARLESLADPGKFGDLDENDPQSVTRWMKKMGREMGEDFGDDFDQAMEEAAHEGEMAGNGDESTNEPAL